MTAEQWEKVKQTFAQALELPPPQRESYVEAACASDPVLLHEVQRLLEAERQAGTGFLNLPTRSVTLEIDDATHDNMSGRRVGAYQVAERIGAGGMGEVYRAFRADDQYSKQVALKVVRSGQGSRFVFERFKNERQILASLDHPNIARLLDGGTTDEGAPYFVMELIEGQPIDKYCDSHKLDITTRLNLFVQVCTALQYAHSRLIVHRDLKPGNIFVTAEGQPKLLDFGIAKILDQGPPGEVAATITMLRVFTPAYASPEQLKGETITTASDIYSLGVILYELLTGHHPYRVSGCNLAAISRAALAVEPEKPSSVVRRVEATSQAGQAEVNPATVSTVREGTLHKLRKRLSGDLDNIILMALRKEPERRYASAEQLGGDISRHLEDLPVVARKDTAGYRAAKFITRHKIGVVATVLAGIMLVGALLVTLREVQVAHEQRARAERRFNDVRQLANSLIFEIHDNIQDLPGATRVRKLLVERALSYLDSLAQEPGSEASLQRELAFAYDKVGEVQGTPFGGNLGDTQGALDSYRKALAIRETLVAANPANVEDALQLAVSQREVAGIAAYRADPEAVGQAEQALAAAQRVLEGAPQNAAALAEVGIDHNMLAGLLDGEADYERSLMHTRAALPIAEQRLRAVRGNRPLQSRVAIIEGRMGYELTRLGLRQEAEEHFRRSIQISESLASDPTDVERKRILALMLQWFAQHLLMLGDVRGASLAYHKAAVILEPQLAADPKNALLDFDLANDRAGWGYTLTMLGDLRRGLVLAKTAEEMLESDVARDPAYVETRESFGTVRIWVGDVLAHRGATAQALEYYEKGLPVLERLSADTKWARYQSEVAVAHTRIGSLYQKIGRSDKAAEEYRRALAIVEPITTAHPHVVDAQYAAAETYADLGELSQRLASDFRRTRQQQQQDWKDARDWYQRSLDAWRDVANPGRTMPSGFACGNPRVVVAMIAKCEAALARLLRS